MISDLQPIAGGAAVVPHGNSDIVLRALDSQPVQPIRDVQAYLMERRPRAHYQGEESLLITLPVKLQREVRALVRAMHFVAKQVKDKWKVQPACKEALRIYSDWHWKLATFRAKFDLWMAKQDWVVLINRAKAPASWRDREGGLPERDAETGR